MAKEHIHVGIFVIGHVDSGKSTTVEKMIYFAERHTVQAMLPTLKKAPSHTHTIELKSQIRELAEANGNDSHKCIFIYGEIERDGDQN
nr:hypothetical protein [Tanacetum cinerariifolium]